MQPTLPYFSFKNVESSFHQNMLCQLQIRQRIKKNKSNPATCFSISRSGGSNKLVNFLLQACLATLKLLLHYFIFSPGAGSPGYHHLLPMALKSYEKVEVTEVNSVWVLQMMHHPLASQCRHTNSQLHMQPFSFAFQFQGVILPNLSLM